MMYSTDLAYIHDAGWGDRARSTAPELIRILRQHGLRSGRIVEAGCGSGILAQCLVEAGYRVHGFDASPAMIRLARQHAPAARFQVASLGRARMPPCDAVVAIGEVMSYVGSWRTITRFFRRVHDALSARGLFIFDFIESGEGRTYSAKSRGGRDWALVARADLDDGGRVLTRHLTMFRKVGGEYRRSREVHRVHIHPRANVATALAGAGFAVHLRRSYGGYRLMHGDVAVIAERR
jgi:SAM-dependent methyltransferase